MCKHWNDKHCECKIECKCNCKCECKDKCKKECECKKYDKCDKDYEYDNCQCFCDIIEKHWKEMY